MIKLNCQKFTDWWGEALNAIWVNILLQQLYSALGMCEMLGEAELAQIPPERWAPHFTCPYGIIAHQSLSVKEPFNSSLWEDIQYSVTCVTTLSGSTHDISYGHNKSEDKLVYHMKVFYGNILTSLYCDDFPKCTYSIPAVKPTSLWEWYIKLFCVSACTFMLAKRKRCHISDLA